MIETQSGLSVCRAFLDDDLMVLENDCILRQYRWNGGDLISRRLVDKSSGRAWALAGAEPDIAFPGEEAPLVDGGLEITPRSASQIRPAHLQVDVTTQFGQLTVLRRLRLYPGCPAIACDVYLRGRPAGVWGQAFIFHLFVLPPVCRPAPQDGGRLGVTGPVWCHRQAGQRHRIVGQVCPTTRWTKIKNSRPDPIGHGQAGQRHRIVGQVCPTYALDEN